MEHHDYEELRAKVEFLSDWQVHDLRVNLRERSEQQDVYEQIEQSFLKRGKCPHCHARTFSPWGSAHGLKRYRCKGCGRTFNALTRTSFSRLRMKEKWPSYFKSLQKSQTVRAAATSVKVTKNTAFRWRHRFLQPQKTSQDENLYLIVEIDETFFRENFKGQKVLPRPARKRGKSDNKPGLSAEYIPVMLAHDRLGHKVDGVMENRSETAVTKILQGRINDQALLCMDGDAAVIAFAKKQGLEYELIIAKNGEHVHEKVLHIQNVNAYTSRLKKWMRLFNGVATKYLQSYIGWRRWLENKAEQITPLGALRSSLATYNT